MMSGAPLATSIALGCLRLDMARLLRWRERERELVRDGLLMDNLQLVMVNDG